MDTVNESLTTVEDGDSTVNERLSPGGEGPEGQSDTATESITGPASAPDATDEPEESDKPAKRKRS